jgi:hypothetical protein
MSVEVKTTLRLRPFEVPDTVRIMLDTEETPDDPSIPIEELDREALDALAGRWLDNLYASVNRPSPFYLGARCQAA